MNDLICQLPNWQHYSIILIISILELWLGKTDKVKAGSILELIFNILLYKKEDKNKELK